MINPYFGQDPCQPFQKKRSDLLGRNRPNPFGADATQLGWARPRLSSLAHIKNRGRKQICWAEISPTPL